MKSQSELNQGNIKSGNNEQCQADDRPRSEQTIVKSKNEFMIRFVWFGEDHAALTKYLLAMNVLSYGSNDMDY